MITNIILIVIILINGIDTAPLPPPCGRRSSRKYTDVECSAINDDCYVEDL